LPDASTLRLEACHIDDVTTQITLCVTSRQVCVPCPLCTRVTSRVHSRYARTLADLPWASYRVRLQLRVRKFFCPHPTCPRQIFTERVPTVAAPWARRTLRLAPSLLAVGVALGGRAGSRLAARLHRPTPPASLLRVVHQAPLPQTPPLKVVGVDEWAWRRGHRYGTILVNLETHRVVDLLPERSADAVARWLAQHPGITAVSRDRSGLYAHGITQGAPHAVQVVDRFHLVSNLREALEAYFFTHPAALKQAAAHTAHPSTQRREAMPVTAMSRGRPHRPQHGGTRQERQRQRRHAVRLARYAAMCRLHKAGATVTAIARRLHCSRTTVYAQLRRGAPPAPKTRTVQPAEYVLAPYIPYLMQRWREGDANGQQLWREIQAQGYQHSARTVRHFLTSLRRAGTAGRLPAVAPSPYTCPQGPSARAVSFVVVSRPEKRSRLAQCYLEHLCQVEAKMAQLYELAVAFLTMVRERRGQDLEAWRTLVAQSGIAPLARFAEGLQEDLAAIQAGLTLPWSNGPVEGQINRLKLLKRQGYGRADVALLRQRVVQAV
jgi:transposase